MKSLWIIAVAGLTLAALATADLADAKRFGGGRSFGTQRQGVAPSTPAAPSTSPAAPSGAASNPVMPASPSTAAAPRAGAPAATPAPSGASRWLGPIAGIAAGLGLAALLSHFGLSEGFASLMMFALLALVAVVVVRWLLARRSPAAAAPMRYAGIPGAETPAPPRGYETQVGPTWGGAAPPVMATASAARKVPAGFDVDGFLRQAKLQFNRLQAAWDIGDRSALADVMTPQMLDEIERDLAGRGKHEPSEVVTLEADLLEVVTEADQHVASIRFHGLMREDGATSPQPFDEVWNLRKSVDGSTGWLLAGVQQMEQAA